jgi:hypothetical protein
MAHSPEQTCGEIKLALHERVREEKRSQEPIIINREHVGKKSIRLRV